MSIPSLDHVYFVGRLWAGELKCIHSNTRSDWQCMEGIPTHNVRRTPYHTGVIKGTKTRSCVQYARAVRWNIELKWTLTDFSHQCYVMAALFCSKVSSHRVASTRNGEVLHMHACTTLGLLHFQDSFMQSFPLSETFLLVGLHYHPPRCTRTVYSVTLISVETQEGCCKLCVLYC